MVVKLRTTQIGLKRPINVKANLTNVDKADEMRRKPLTTNNKTTAKHSKPD